MNLYEVTKVYYVAAETEGEAEYVTPDITACDTEVEEIADISEVLSGWVGAIPFGSADGKTCAEILAGE